MKAGKRPTRKNQQGNALLLAVLILLSMTSLGIISVQLTNTDLMVAGNLARAWQAETAGRAGAAHGMALVGINPGKFMQATGDQRERELTNAGTGSKEMGANIFQASSADPTPTDNPDPLGETNPLIPVNSTDMTAHVPTLEFGANCVRTQQDVAYDVEFKYIGESRAQEGHSAKADICHVILDFNARGGIPTGTQHAAATLGQEDTVVVRNRARGMAGPLQCRLR